MHSRSFRAILAIVFVTVISGASFYISSRLSSTNSVSPNAPDSKPQAAAKAQLSKEDREELAASKAKSTQQPKIETNIKNTNPKEEKDDAFYLSRTSNPTPKSVTVAPGSLTEANRGQQNNSAQQPSTTQVTVPTPAKDTFGSTQTTAGQSYTSADNNKCDDGLGFVSGTGCINGQRRVVGGSEKAAQEYYQNNAERLAAMSDKEILEKAGMVCDPTKKNCQTAIEEAQNKVLAQNIILDPKFIDEISTRRLQFQALKDIADPSACNDTCLKNKYGSAKPEAILTELKITDPDTLKKSSEVRKNNQVAFEVSTYKTEIEKYLSTATDGQLAAEYCKGSSTPTSCKKEFNREQILSGITDPKPYLQIKMDEVNANNFANPAFSFTELKRVMCNYVSSCVAKINNKNDLLTLIQDPETRKIAEGNRLLALQSYIPLVATKDPVAVPGIDNETKKEIIKLNEDVTHAFWVYVRSDENTKRQRNGVTSSQLAEEFEKMLKADPSLLTKNIETYNSSPKEYNIQFTNIDFSKEPNPIIASQINQIIKTQSISGLANNGKAVIFANADPIYKLQAMAQSCQDKSPILSSNECRSVNGMVKNVKNINNPTKEELALIETFTTTPLSNKFASAKNSQLYVQEVFNNLAGTNNLLSTYQSNIVDINNAAVSNEERQKALAAANREAKLDLFDPKNGFGNLAGTSTVVPQSVRNNLPETKKITQDQVNELANQYLERQLVVETYKRGGGIGGTLAAAGGATALCTALGPEAWALAPICGAVGGLAGALSTWVPILGTATAEEIEAERKAIADFVGNDAAASFIQALYSNQGAWGDEGAGRSITTKDNAFATLDSIQTVIQNNGATLDQINNDPSIMAEIALQPFINNQWEALQNENETQAWVNAAVAPIVGGLSGGVASNIMGQVVKNSTPTLTQIFTDVAYDSALWAGGAVINDLQTQIQFDQTTTYVDTQAEIALIACQRTDGVGNCEDESVAVTAETEQARIDNRVQAAVSDFVIQAGQTSFSLAGQINNYIKTTSPEVKINPSTKTDTNNTTNIAAETVKNTGKLTTYATAADIEQIILSKISGSEKPTVTKAVELPSDIREIVKYVSDNSHQPNELFETQVRQQGFTGNEIEIALSIRNNEAFNNFIENPSQANHETLLRTVEVETERLNTNSSPTAYLDALELLHQTRNPSTASNTENLIAFVRTEIISPPDTTPINNISPTSIDPQTEAIQRLINQRARQDHNLSIDELNTLFEGIEITDRIINQIHTLQENPEFINATDRIARTISESESAKAKLTKLNSPTENFDQESQKMIFDLTTELAQKLTTPTAKPQTQATAQPNTPPPPVPPTKPKRSNTTYVDGNNNYLLTLAKDLGVSTTNKTDAQIRTEVKQEMNRRVFGNENGPADPTGNTEISGFVFRDSEGNVLSNDLYWRPESFGDPFVFTREQADAIFANSNNWQFKPDRTIEVIYNPTSKKTKLANGIPFFAELTKIDPDGNIHFTVPGAEGVVFIADRNSDLAQATKGMTQADLAGKKIADLTITNSKPQTTRAKNNPLLPESLRKDVGRYAETQVEQFNRNLADPSYRPSDNRLVRVLDVLKLTPEARLLYAARQLKQVDGTPYDLNRPLSEIAADVRTADSKIVNRKNNQSVLTAEERKIAALGIPRRIAEKIIEMYRIDPTLKISEINIEGVRFWSGNYLDGNPVWTKFQADIQERVTSGTITKEQGESIINATREHLTDNIKSSILKNNPDFVLSPKNGYIDTFLDLNADRISSIENMKDFLKPGGEFETDLKLAIAEMNKTLRSGGKIKRFQIDKSWNLSTLEIANLKPGDVLLLGLSQDPTLPTKFHFVDNEIYSSYQGNNGEILNAVFAGKLKEEIPNIDSQLPIIEQASLDTPGAGKYHYGAKNIDIYGVAIDPETIRNTPPKPSGTNEKYSSLANYSAEEINLLASRNHETGTSGEGLINSLSNPERSVVTKQQLIDMEMNGSTDFIIAHTTQIAGDLARFSTSVDVLTKHTRSTEGISETTVVFEGWAVIESALQDNMTIRIKEIGGFNTHEHAGDGIRGLSLHEIDLGKVSQLVEMSSLYKEIITKAANGEYGTSAQRTAEILLKQLGDNVFLKIGIGTGNTVVTLHSGDNNLSTEFKSTVNVDEQLDNVKKYIDQERATGNTPPEKIIGVNKDFYDKYSDLELAKKGLMKIEVDIKIEVDGKVEIKKAYLVAKIGKADYTPKMLNAPLPSKNNGVKIKIIETIKLLMGNDSTNSTNQKTFKLKTTDLVENIGTNQTAEGRVYKITTAVNNQIIDIAVKVYGSESDFINESNNYPIINKILGDFSTKYLGITEIDSRPIGIAIELIENGSNNPKNTKTIQDLLEIQKRLNLSGYTIFDFQYLTLPDGSVKVMDVSKVYKTNNIADLPYQDGIVDTLSIEFGVPKTEIELSFDYYYRRSAVYEQKSSPAGFRAKQLAEELGITYIDDLNSMNLNSIPKNNGIKIRIIEVIEGFFPIANTKSATFKDLYLNIKNDVSATYPQSRFKENFVDPFNNARTNIKKRASELVKVLSIQKLPEQTKTPTAAPAPTKTTKIDFSKDLTVDEIRQIVPDFVGDLTDEDIKTINFQLKYYTIGRNSNDILVIPVNYGRESEVYNLHPLLKTLLENAKKDRVSEAYGYNVDKRFANIAEAYLNKKNTSQQEKPPVIVEPRSKAATDLGVVPSKGFFVTSITAGFLSLFGLIFQAINGNSTTFTAPTPTPTVSITPTIIPSTSINPTISISPTINPLSPTPTQTTTNETYSLPARGSLTNSDMTTFALAAKNIGQMVINCQAKGINEGQVFYDCLCGQMENKCQGGGGNIEHEVAKSLKERASTYNGSNPLECVDFVYVAEISRINPVATGCFNNADNEGRNTNNANNMTGVCNGINTYYCPQSAIEQSGGFVEGDILVWQDGYDGHTAICTETSSDDSECNVIEANKKDNPTDPTHGRVEFRPVTVQNNFDGVWRSLPSNSPKLENCTLK